MWPGLPQKRTLQANCWDALWGWYDEGGFDHVAAYLAGLDLAGFNPKEPPPKTPAFWDIVNASRAPEDAEMSDILEYLGNRQAVTLLAIILKALEDKRHEFVDWLTDRKNRRILPHRFEACGYVPVRNPNAEDGLWKIANRRQVIYARANLSLADQIRAARSM